ncbi:MAG: hypothetical protein ACK4RM_01895 [Flavobacterium sp.]
MFCFFVLLVYGFSQGFENKYGHEWLPEVLKIGFDYFNITKEDKKKILYTLS